MTTKHRDVAIPMRTARLESSFPYISLTMSVTRNVEANRIFPSVISIPKARTRISTSIFAAMVASAIHIYSPCFPKRR